MNRPILLLALSAAFFTTAAGAEETTVYKTTNADGTVSYSQTHSDGAEERVVHSSGASSKVEKDEAAPAAIPDEMPASAEATAASQKEACDVATANLAILQTGQVVTRTNAAGETETLTAEDVAASRVEAEKQVSTYCRDKTGV